MKKGAKKSIIALIMILTFTWMAQEGDSFSFGESCTIPAIPGVNAPLVEEERQNTKVEASAQKEEPQKEPSAQSPALIQQDSQEEKTTAQEQKILATVKTVYSR